MFVALAFIVYILNKMTVALLRLLILEFLPSGGFSVAPFSLENVIRGLPHRIPVTVTTAAGSLAYFNFFLSQLHNYFI
jgi:hypothetical protein